MSEEAPSEAQDTALFLHLIALLQTLALQAMGKLANPLTGEAERNLEHAGVVIETLAMLERKTEGQLTDDENRALADALYHLRMNFVEESRKPETDDESPAAEDAAEETDEGSSATQAPESDA
jgi:hypothetical protein